MKKYISVILLTVFVTVILAHSSYSGYTKKSNSSGCTCHGSNPGGTVTVTITGPSQVQTGSTTTYQVTIAGGSGTKVCADIAASAGTLQAYDSALKLSGSELITNGTKTYTNGQYTYSFNYIAPSTAGTQTLYATGLATNSISGQWNFAPDKSIAVVSTTDVADNSIPNKFSLDQNYPNPFNPSTVINYRVPLASTVSLKVYDTLGKEVATLVDEIKQPGVYSFTLNTANYSLSSGIYYYRLQAGGFTSVRKMLLIK